MSPDELRERVRGMIMGPLELDVPHHHPGLTMRVLHLAIAACRAHILLGEADRLLAGHPAGFAVRVANEIIGRALENKAPTDEG